VFCFIAATDWLKPSHISPLAPPMFKVHYWVWGLRGRGMGGGRGKGEAEGKARKGKAFCFTDRLRAMPDPQNSLQIFRRERAGRLPPGRTDQAVNMPESWHGKRKVFKRGCDPQSGLCLRAHARRHTAEVIGSLRPNGNYQAALEGRQDHQEKKGAAWWRRAGQAGNAWSGPKRG